MIDIAILRAMAAAGATVEMILAAVEAAQNAHHDALEKRRQSDRVRQSKARQSKNSHVTSRDPETVTLPVDGPPSPPSPLNGSPLDPLPVKTLSPPLPPVGADDKTRDVAKSLISEAAFDLARRVLDLQGLDRDDPRSMGTAYQVQEWLTKGWDDPAITQGVQTVMARRQAAPQSLRYFEGAIARVVADRARSLPVAEPLPASNVIGGDFGSGGRRAYPHAGPAPTHADIVMAGMGASHAKRKQAREQDRCGTVPNGNVLAIEHVTIRKPNCGDDRLL